MFKEEAFKILGYSPDQTVAGMLASDLPKLKRIEKALEEAYRKGQESMMADQPTKEDIENVTGTNPYLIGGK